MPNKFQNIYDTAKIASDRNSYFDHNLNNNTEEASVSQTQHQMAINFNDPDVASLQAHQIQMKKLSEGLNFNSTT